MRALWIGVTVVLFAALVGAGVWWTLGLQTGLPLSDREQAELLQRSNLPADFPIHPGARRMPQPQRGGLSYAVNMAVPDAALWLRDQLGRTGFQVDAAELEGDLEYEYKERWINYGRRRGGVTSTGWVIVRQVGKGSGVVTEVKVLSEQDERLRQLPTPTRAATVDRSS